MRVIRAIGWTMAVVLLAELGLSYYWWQLGDWSQSLGLVVCAAGQTAVLVGGR